MDQEFTFTDQDLEDPSLLAELAQLGIADQPEVTLKQVEKVAKVEIGGEFDDVDVEFDEKDMEDPELLRDLQGLQDVNHNDQSVEVVDQVTADDDFLKELNKEEVKQVSPSIDQLVNLERKALEFKKTALKFKKENNLPKAREALVAFKKVQEQIDRINSGFAVSPGFLIPELSLQSPVATVAGNDTRNTATDARKSVKKVDVVAKLIEKQIIPVDDDKVDPLKEIENRMESKDIFIHLSDLLKEQIKTCTNLSGYFFKSGKKDKALEFHKYKKTFLGDLESLLALSQTHGANPPTFSYFNVSYDIEIRIPELGSNDLLFSIIKGYDMNSFTGEDFSISFKIEGLEESGGSGEVSFKKENTPDIKFSKTINIQRNKTFQRILERKKCILELYSCSTQFFIMKKKTLIAKCSSKLDNLLNKCEIHEILNFVDPTNPRKSLNSRLEIKLSLTQPLIKPEIVSKQERWIQIVFDKREKAQVLTETPVVQVKPSKPLPETSEIPASISPTASTSDQNEVEDTLLAFKNVDLIVSNLVLEHESAEIAKEIQNLKSNGKSVPAELSDQLLSYEIKMNLLVSLVQMGTLTPQAYLEQLNNYLKDTKKVALLFKKAGKSEEAQKAMIRMKLITREISEISG